MSLSEFQVIPAIDLLGGKCVRLRQGDYTQETVCGNNPTQMAEYCVREGTQRLHQVDREERKKKILIGG